MLNTSEQLVVFQEVPWDQGPHTSSVSSFNTNPSPSPDTPRKHISGTNFSKRLQLTVLLPVISDKKGHQSMIVLWYHLLINPISVIHGMFLGSLQTLDAALYLPNQHALKKDAVGAQNINAQNSHAQNFKLSQLFPIHIWMN